MYRKLCVCGILLWISFANYEQRGVLLDYYRVSFEDEPVVDKRYLVLHAGPAKTGSTTLQEALTAMEIDNYVYLGKYVKDGRKILEKSKEPLAEALESPRCKRNSLHSNVASLPCWHQMLNMTEEFRDSNLLFSQEYLCSHGNLEIPQWWEGLRNLPYHQIVVVLTYRPYYSWLLSAQSEINTREHYHPDQNDSHTMFPIDTPNAFDGGSFMHTNEAYRLYSKFFPVRLIRMGPDLLKNLICDGLIGADETCQTVEPAEKKNVRSVRLLRYDRIVLAAKKKFNITMDKRHKYIKATRLHQERDLNLTDSEFPLVCPPREQLEALLEKSLKMEAELFPDEDPGPHIEGFWKSADRFCVVDTDAVLQDPHWESFFSAW